VSRPRVTGRQRKRRISVEVDASGTSTTNTTPLVRRCTIKAGARRGRAPHGTSILVRTPRCPRSRDRDHVRRRGIAPAVRAKRAGGPALLLRYIRIDELCPQFDERLCLGRSRTHRFGDSNKHWIRVLTITSTCNVCSKTLTSICIKQLVCVHASLSMVLQSRSRFKGREHTERSTKAYPSNTAVGRFVPPISRIGHKTPGGVYGGGALSGPTLFMQD